MLYNNPITEIIKRRFSCRSYLDQPIEEQARQQLADMMSSCRTGPFGSRTRFELVAATQDDRQALKGLGTYGFIKGATGFIAGAVERAEQDMEDYGYLMEQIILLATDIGLGTCWLGGSFTKSQFAARIALRDGESLPAIASVGHIAGTPRRIDGLIRRVAKSDKRLPWQSLFFDTTLDTPLSRPAAGAYAVPLDMVRLAPSASNKQPWRIVKQDDTWHFYLQRTPGYGKHLKQMSDLQRLDVGIAMSHFELTANELGLQGEWMQDKPPAAGPDEPAAHTATYIASWVSVDL